MITFDICAAPGGKSLAIAINKNVIFSNDKSKIRLKMLEKVQNQEHLVTILR